MIISQLQRPHCQSVRQRRSQSALPEESQADAKSYRCLLSLFTDNLNTIMRSHRDCLGDMEMLPKIKISREEQRDITEHLNKLYPKLADKMSRQLIYRNINTRKTYQQYYYYFKLTQTQQTRQDYQAKDLYLEETITSQKNMFNSLPSAKRNANCNSISSVKRPLSSKGYQGGGMATITQGLNGFKTTGVGQSYKMKTISAQINQNPEQKSDKRYIMSTQRGILRQQVYMSKKDIKSRQKQQKDNKRYDQNDEFNGFIFNGNQIMINEKRQFKKQIDQAVSKRNPSIFQSSKISCKRMINLKYSQRKSIDQIQKMQIQNRLMMVNSVLSVNLAQSQGYRPKSKCWQNYFNQ